MMWPRPFRITAHSGGYARDGLDVWFTTVESASNLGKFRKFDFTVTETEHQEGDCVDPSMRLTREQARGLMDALWSAGVRPATDDPASDKGELVATKRHLEDMRLLALGKRK